jgi:hypothetical protein
LKFFANPEPLSGLIEASVDRVHMLNRNPIFANDRWSGEAGVGFIGERIP